MFKSNDKPEALRLNRQAVEDTCSSADWSILTDQSKLQRLVYLLTTIQICC
jgi:hypothetical protein